MINVPSAVEVMLSGNIRVAGSVISVMPWAAHIPAASKVIVGAFLLTYSGTMARTWSVFRFLA
jgi:hypothetical protein